MSLSGPGILYPSYPEFVNTTGLGLGTAIAMAAAGDQVAYLGRCYIDGRPSSSKTLSQAGGGTIGWRSGAVTLANGTTSLDLGIQGVSTSAGPAIQPDGSYSTKGTYTSAAAPTASSWNTKAMGSGTVSISYGQLIAVVWNMTARGGADSVQVNPTSAVATGLTMPGVNDNLSGAGWLATGAQGLPNMVITFDDGTLGTIDNSYPLTSTTNETFQTGTNPNERGVSFSLPFACYVDGLWAFCLQATSAADYTIGLYRDPFASSGGPTLLASVVMDANTAGVANANRQTIHCLSTPVLLQANTTYGVALRATAAANVGLTLINLNSNSFDALYPGGTSVDSITRNGSVGAFGGAASSLYLMGIRISEISPLTTTNPVNFGGL